MKKIILSLACFMGSVSAFAYQYDCHSIDDKVQAFLVFDDGPGGLDDFTMRAYGVDYADMVWDNNSDVVDVDSRDTFKKTYDYGMKKVEIGFDAKNGAKFDIFIKRLGETAVYDGTLYTKIKGKKSAVAFTCNMQEG